MLSPKSFPDGPDTFCQAIAINELSKLDGEGQPLYRDIINDSLTTAHWMFPKQSHATVEELAVELMVSVASRSLSPCR